MQREKNNNFILDFTGVYDDEFAKEKTSLTWIVQDVICMYQTKLKNR